MKFRLPHLPLPRALLALALGLMAAGTASAQVTLTLKPDRERYLPYEPIRVEAIVLNNSGNPLVFPDDRHQASMDFEVRKLGAYQLATTNRAFNPVAGLVLDAGARKSLPIQINALFPMQEEGLYSIQAQLTHPRLSKMHLSPTVTIQVVPGNALWHTSFGVPAADLNGKIEQRTLTLLSFSEGKELGLAMTIANDDYVFAVKRLGAHISGFRPECELDAMNNIHLLTLYRPRLVEYRVFDPTLNLLQRSFYVPLEQSWPRLNRDPDLGRVLLQGGRPAVEGSDYQFTEPGKEPAAKTPAPANNPPR